jgi:hypothetical protein
VCGRKGRTVALLALGGVMPPRLGLIAGKEAGYRDEGVEHTRILSGTSCTAEREVQRVRICTREFPRRCISQLREIARHGGADIGEVGKVREARAADFGGMHG